MYNKIVLAGGSGHLGRVLAGYYRQKANEIVILSRKSPERQASRYCNVHWDGENRGAWEEALEGADLLVNLCGKSVNCSYTEAAKAGILRSRVGPTALLGASVAALSHPPTCWINLSSATIYRHAEDCPQDEEAGETGTGFSVDVCTDWEKTFWQCPAPQTKKVVLRAGIVLSAQAGAFPRLKQLVQAGLGGRQGSGRQRVSWIHEQDFARMTEWIMVQGKSPVYNGTAPVAIQNTALMQLLRKSYGLPVGLPSPQWLLELGARLIGTETELLLKSRWVYPKRLLDEGFRFSFPQLAAAVRALLSTSN